MIFLKLDFVDYLKFEIHFKSLKICMLFQMAKQIHFLPTSLRQWEYHPKHTYFYLVPFLKKRRALSSQCEQNIDISFWRH